MRSLALFAFAGGVGFLVDTAVLYLALPFLGPYAGRVLSFLAAVLATWLLNRRLAFGQRPSGLPVWQEALRYLMIMLIGGGANLAVYSLCIATLPVVAAYPVLGVAVGSLAGLSLNFAIARAALFRKQSTA